MNEARAKLAAAGLDPFIERVTASARPCVQISPAAGAPHTFSKFGGDPDVPAGFTWPHRAPRRSRMLGWRRRERPLGFLAQIDLATAALCDVSKRLPPDGCLWFFYDLNDFPWGGDPADRDGCRVVYAPGPVTITAPLAAPRGAYGPASGERPFAERRVEFRPGVTYADPRELVTPDDPEHLAARLGDVMIALDTADHRLLGHPTLVQNPMELECQLAFNGIMAGGGKLSPEDQARAKALEPGAADWTLLLQLASDETWMWGDVGLLYFWVRKQDLAAHDFSNVWVVLQCS